MKAIVNFDVGCRELDSRLQSGGLILKTAAPFRRIGEVTGCGPRQNPAFIVVEVPLGHPGLPEALRIIKEETGLIPSPNTRIPRREWSAPRYFAARIFREYGEKDLRDLPFLFVNCACQIADSKGQTEDERCIVEVNKRLKAKWDFGSVGFRPVYALSTHLKELLEREGMTGFCPRPVLFDKPEKAARELWQLWSDVVMPPCLLPLYDDAGEPTTQDNLADPIEYTDRPRDPGRGVYYNGGPYRDFELCFSASEVAALGDFDVAITRERVGIGKRGALRRLIISQRFRQVLMREKLPGMEHIPVRLLKLGDPLWENPFESMVGPYDEKPPLADR
jgi:hypothetical protein